MKNLKQIFFYEPGEGTRVHLVIHWLLSLVIMVAAGIGMGLLGLYYGKITYGPEMYDSYLNNPTILWLNLIPTVYIILLMFLVFNRVWAGLLAGGGISLVLMLIHHFKLMFRNDPLMFSDASYITEAAQISERYNIVFTPKIWLTIAAVFVAAVVAFLIFRARFRRLVPRLVCLAVCIATGIGLYFGVYTNKAIYDSINNFGVEFEDGTVMNIWNDTDRYCSRGFWYPLIYSSGQTKNQKPDGYSKSAALEALAQHEDANIPAEKRVNFLSIMLEAYNDFSTYGDLFPFETDPYEFFHELQAESYHGTLVTNIFAGGTIDTERCYISGSNEMYEYRGEAWSYGWYFDGQGYTTQFCHPGHDWYYNRKNVMEYLGFPTRYFYQTRYDWLPKAWGIMGDDEFFPGLARLFDEGTASGTPWFNFSVTYQNHGPYSAEQLYDPDREYLPRGTLSEASYTILNNYFWGIRRTDDSLRLLVEHFRESDEPVVLVLFGDHKPWLGDGGSVYHELGLDMSQTDRESFYNYYATQYTVWANDAAREILGDRFHGVGEDISPGFLMMKVFDLCGYVGPSYTQSQRELFQDVQVINISGRFIENGVLTDELSEEAKEKLDRVLYMQYYYMRDWARGGH